MSDGTALGVLWDRHGHGHSVVRRDIRGWPVILLAGGVRWSVPPAAIGDRGQALSWSAPEALGSPGADVGAGGASPVEKIPPAAAASPVPRDSQTLPGVEAAAVLLERVRSIVLAWKRGGGDDADGADPFAAMCAIAQVMEGQQPFGVRMGWLEDDGAEVSAALALLLRDRIRVDTLREPSGYGSADLCEPDEGTEVLPWDGEPAPVGTTGTATVQGLRTVRSDEDPSCAVDERVDVPVRWAVVGHAAMVTWEEIT